jgi:excisionase family DNA binding protein
VPVADKLTLSLAEAAALAGYSKEFLREAIKGKHLKAARGRTRGYNIKRADLLAWIDGL